jgi:hypothetical protein
VALFFFILSARRRNWVRQWFLALERKPARLRETIVIQLQSIIDVREIPPCASRQRQTLPSIRSMVRETAAPDEVMMLGYLRQGVPCGVYNDPRLLHDVLTPGNRLDPDANLLLTDGVWIWPKALVHYLHNYHIKLPTTFLSHARQNGWRIEPSAIDLQEVNADAFDAIPAQPSATRAESALKPTSTAAAI